MIRKLQLVDSTKLIVLITIFYAVGIFLSVVFGISTIASLTPLVLAATTAIIFLYSVTKWTKQIIVTLFVIGILGFLFEAIGVNTGVLFGEYSYGGVLGPNLLNVPLLLIIMWPLVSWFGLCVFYLLPEKQVWTKLLVASLAVVLYDVFLEPFAVATGMWEWTGEVIPFKNYLTWFAISIIFIFILIKSKIRPINEKFVVLAMGMQAIYFFVISMLAAVQ